MKRGSDQKSESLESAGAVMIQKYHRQSELYRDQSLLCVFLGDTTSKGGVYCLLGWLYCKLWPTCLQPATAPIIIFIVDVEYIGPYIQHILRVL